MPNLGDIRKATEVGMKGNGDVVYLGCPDCSLKRWTHAIRGRYAPESKKMALYRRCKPCSKKTRPRWLIGPPAEKTRGFK